MLCPYDSEQQRHPPALPGGLCGHGYIVLAFSRASSMLPTM